MDFRHIFMHALSSLSFDAGVNVILVGVHIPLKRDNLTAPKPEKLLGQYIVFFETVITLGGN